MNQWLRIPVAVIVKPRIIVVKPIVGSPAVSAPHYFYSFQAGHWNRFSSLRCSVQKQIGCRAGGMRHPRRPPRESIAHDRARVRPAQNHLNFLQIKTMKSLFTACALALLAFSPVVFAAAASSCGCCTCDSCECENCNCCDCTACDC